MGDSGHIPDKNAADLSAKVPQDGIKPRLYENLTESEVRKVLESLPSDPSTPDWMAVQRFLKQLSEQPQGVRYGEFLEKKMQGRRSIKRFRMLRRAVNIYTRAHLGRTFEQTYFWPACGEYGWDDKAGPLLVLWWAKGRRAKRPAEFGHPKQTVSAQLAQMQASNAAAGPNAVPPARASAQPDQPSEDRLIATIKSETVTRILKSGQDGAMNADGWIEAIRRLHNSDNVQATQVCDYERCPIPTGLPPLHGTFVDRHAEKSTLLHLLRHGESPLLSIVAPAGHGKTELVTKLLWEVAPTGFRIDVPDVKGILYLGCEGGQISLEYVFAQSGRIVGQGPSFEQMYRAREKDLDDKLRFLFQELARAGNVWMVFDNFENLLDADGRVVNAELRRLFEFALGRAHSTRLIVASRMLPCLEGSRRLHLIDLMRGLPEDQAALYLRTEGAACGLADADDQVLRAFARRVHGIPKALESLIGYLEQCDTVQLAELLEDRRLFADFDRYDIEAGLKHLMAEQVLHLPPDAQIAAKIISLFCGTAPPAALKYIEPGFEWQAICSRLQRFRLIYRNGQGYGRHPLLKELMRLQHEDGPYSTLAIRRKQVQYCLEAPAKIIEAQGERCTIPHARTIWLDHARQAITYAEAAEDHPSMARAYLLASGILTDMKRFSDALVMARKASASAELAGDRRLLAETLGRRAGISAADNAEFGDSSLLKQAMGLVPDDAQLQAALWQCMAQTAMARGDLEAARKTLTEANKYITELRDGVMQAANFQMWGEYHALRGEWQNVAANATKALEAFADQKHVGGTCAAMGLLGLARCRLGQLDRGLQDLREAFRVERDILDSREGAAKWFFALGSMFVDRGEYARGLSALWHSQRLWEELDHLDAQKAKRTLARVRRLLGEAAYAETAAAYLPSRSELAEFAFLWGLGPFRRHCDNPVTVANRPGGDESKPAHSPTAWTDGAQVYLLYCAGEPSNPAERTSAPRIYLGVSSDGIHFKSHATPIIEPAEPYETGGCEEPRVVRVDGSFCMTYTAYHGTVARLCMAVSRDLCHWEKRGPLFTDEQWEQFFPHDARERWKVPRGWSRCGAILPQKIKDRYWMFFGDTHIWAAWSSDLGAWHIVDQPVVSPRMGRSDARSVEPGPPPVLTREGIWLGYNCVDDIMRYSFGQALLSAEDPTSLRCRSARPVFQALDRTDGPVKDTVLANGLVRFQGRWLLYYGSAKSSIGVAIADDPDV